MERSEPTLVPEWLKGSNGGVTGAGSSLQHLSSSSQSDDHHSSASTKIRLPVSNDQGTPRSSGFSDRTSYSHFRRNSTSNGSVLPDKDSFLYSRPYSSFGRSHRDRDRDKDLEYREKERLLLDDHDISDSLTLLTSRIEKDTLRRSQSMRSAKRAEVWPKRVGSETNNGLHAGGSTGSIGTHIHKSSFERDFPSLGAEEKPAVPEIGRVSSPGLITSQSFPMSSSVVIGGDGWTSALAEVPFLISGNGSSVPQIVPASSATVQLSTTQGLNMAETLAQAPSRARTAPQLSAETQRLEELAIKQSRQLIPMTPSTTPKTSALTSSEKSKPKVSRTGELSIITKVGQQASSQLVSHALRGSARSEVLKFPQSTSKLLVLKGRERNGISGTTAIKEAVSPTNANRALPGAVPPSAAVAAPVRTPSSPKPRVQNSSMLDKRPPSQAQNRNDFFNSLRKKVSSSNNNHSPEKSISSSVVTSSLLGKSEKQMPERSASSVLQGTESAAAQGFHLDVAQMENGRSHFCNDDACQELPLFSSGGVRSLDSDPVVYPDEEEAAFLRSLGWEENAGEEEALTEEEIKAFYEEYMKTRPTAKQCGGLQQFKNMPPLESHVGSLGGVSSGLCSSDSESEV